MIATVATAIAGATRAVTGAFRAIGTADTLDSLFL